MGSLAYLLAATAGLTLQEFRNEFGYLVEDEPPALVMDATLGGFLEGPGPGTPHEG